MTVRTTWTGDPSLLREVENILTELIEPPVDAVSLVKSEDDISEGTNKDWLLHTYTDEPLGAATLTMLPDGLTEPQVEHLEDRDWVAHALQGLGVVRAGSFILYGRHDRDEARALDGIPLEIEANQAFGTGHHPTTAGCLEALSRLQSETVTSVADIGTGSGVLAFASRKLWPNASVLATDIDATSIDIAKINAETNDVEGVTWHVGDGFPESASVNAPKFDLIIANILAGPLIELSSSIKDHLTDDGWVVLAGLLDEQEQSVTRAFADVGLSVMRHEGTARWPVLVLR